MPLKCSQHKCAEPHRPYSYMATRAEGPGFECVRARLGRLENLKTHKLLFHFGLVTRISYKISLKSSILLEDILQRNVFSLTKRDFP